MTGFGVDSEAGKLRKVMVHQPDLSLRRLTPANHTSFLFDDVLWVDQALREHNAFVRLIRNEGVKVYYLQELLAETLSTGDEIRRQMIEGVSAEMSVGISALDAVQICLMDMEGADLARHLIGGLTVSELECVYMEGLARFSLTAAVWKVSPGSRSPLLWPGRMPLFSRHSLTLSLPAILQAGFIMGSPSTLCTGLRAVQRLLMQQRYTTIIRCSGMQISGSGSRCRGMKKGSVS